MGVKSLVKGLWMEKENRRYQTRLQEMRTSYPDWLGGMSEGQGISGAFDVMAAEDRPAEGRAAQNQKAETPAGEELAVICAAEGELSSHAIESIRAYFSRHPQVQVMYGDEDVRGECDPWFKPGWSPDLLDSYLYFGSVVVLRRELYDRVCSLYGGTFADACGDALGKGARQPDNVPKSDMPEGGRQEKKSRLKENGIVIYQVADLEAYERWIHCAVSMAGAYLKGSSTIGHIPEILFHCKTEGEQEKYRQKSTLLEQEKERLLRDFRDGCGVRTQEDPVISIVIPSKDHPGILEKCIRGCMLAGDLEKEKHLQCEILVVDNGSSPENRQCVLHMAEKLSLRSCPVRYLYHPMDFHFSRMCNLGAEEARGDFLLLLNDDVELCQPGCLEEMAALAERPYTGAVGLKLYYPDSRRIQHAGITNLPMGPVHKLQFLSDEEEYYFGANRGARNVLAVTAACLMVEKTKYQEAGGFSEKLRVAFNDVDFCFKLYELGYQNVCVNDRYAYHYESLSRGDDESEEKLERLLAEREELYRGHPFLEGRDPYYSIHLNRAGLDTRIRPGYVTAGNCPQMVETALQRFSFQNYRQDACLLFRVEECRSVEDPGGIRAVSALENLKGEDPGRSACEGKILGYGVVLGDNNACYETWLLFAREDSGGEGGQDAAGTVYGLRIKAQYRPDLQENMPDQTNVALAGFDVRMKRGALPEGTYRLGMAVKNRVTGTKLAGWCNRRIIFWEERHGLG